MNVLHKMPISYHGKVVGKASTTEDTMTVVFYDDFLKNFNDLAIAGLVYGFELKVLNNPAIPLRDGAVVPLTPEDIDNRTLFHKGTDETIPQHAVVRKHFHAIMTMMNEVLPDGRAKSVCMTELETAEMWANKAVAEQAPIVRE